MDKYLAGQALNIKVPLVDAVGALINATAVSYRLLNEAGAVIVGATVVNPFVAGSEDVTIATSSANNTLTGVTRGLRVLELTLTTAAGPRLVEQSYLIETLEPLVVPDESFQTLKQAELLGVSMPQIPSWELASRDARVAALIQARLHIAALAYRFTFADDQSHLEPEFGVSDLKLLSTAEFNELSDEFKVALKRAQVFEADDILAGTTTLEGKRRAGLLSETIGESSMMFRSGRRPNYSTGDRATRVLAKYLVRGLRIGRA